MRVSRDNAPINITRRAETFIYLYSSPERVARRRGAVDVGGKGAKSSFIYGLSS